ncbi:MAG: heme exporter protein CcmB [Zetaproteobacteria bacterium]|nr:heme exporter protein CcmB [Zetaproteobacteria bacterium]
MKKTNSFGIVSLTRFLLTCEKADEARRWTPIFFALTIWLIFQFGHEYKQTLSGDLSWVSEFHLALFFAAELSIVSAFTPDLEDNGLNFLLQGLPSPLYLFVSKILVTCIQIVRIWLPLILVHSSWFIPQGYELGTVWPWANGLLTILGLSTLGILLSALTMTTKVREILFPFLFFPMVIPVLLCSMESSIAYVQQDLTTAQTWLWLLTGFNVIFMTLGLLLFDQWSSQQ